MFKKLQYHEGEEKKGKERNWSGLNKGAITTPWTIKNSTISMEYKL